MPMYYIVYGTRFVSLYKIIDNAIDFFYSFFLFFARTFDRGSGIGNELLSNVCRSQVADDYFSIVIIKHNNAVMSLATTTTSSLFNGDAFFLIFIDKCLHDLRSTTRPALFRMTH